MNLLGIQIVNPCLMLRYMLPQTKIDQACANRIQSTAGTGLKIAAFIYIPFSLT